MVFLHGDGNGSVSFVTVGKRIKLAVTSIPSVVLASPYFTTWKGARVVMVMRMPVARIEASKQCRWQ